MDSLRLRNELDRYYKQLNTLILERQHPITGLLPASTAVTTHGDYRDAWVRDNVYSVLSVWGLSVAYRALDADGGREFELRQRSVKLMRGLLRSMMAQASKVEAFKKSRHPKDALHAKYDTDTGNVTVGDLEWGHLQIDATSLYLLTLVQMIASGLEIIWDLEEINFVQNLVYYVERAYRTPDYGIWERGAKSNRGSVELNASSLGMAKAALEAVAGFDLFGAKGSAYSTIHVSPDNIAQANITLKSMLPRESHTKETDAALLSIIGYPAYAVADVELCKRVKSDVVSKLQGSYGLRRFLRDGHQTVLEDEGRLHYEEAELQEFEHIESEWPLFFCYLYLDALLTGDKETAEAYRSRLGYLEVKSDQLGLLPELYYVPAAAIAAEKAEPGSQRRTPNENVPLVWAQSLYILGQLIDDGLLRPNDIDPLGRRRRRAPRRPVVQLILLAEDAALQTELAEHGVVAETLEDISPVVVYQPQDIAAVYGQVGRNDRLGLTGRSARMLKTLTTSRVYQLRGETALCLASFFLQREFFLAWDIDFLVRRFKSELAYLSRNWTETGRPTVTLLLTRSLLGANLNSFYSVMQQINQGDVEGIPVRRGRVAELMPTASVERITELHDLRLPTVPLEEALSHESLLGTPGRQQELPPAEEIAIETTSELAPLLDRLEHTDNLYEQVELLAAIYKLTDLDTGVQLHGARRTVAELIEDVYEHAGRLRLWAVVRKAAGLLGKVDGDLSLAVGAILVRQKMIQVGRAYSHASLIMHPIPEHELLARIRQFGREDIRDRVLSQELLLYLGTLINAQPELFSELLTVRVGQLINLLTSQLARERSTSVDEAYEQLMHLAPSEVQRRVEGVLKTWSHLEALPQEQEHLDAQSRSGSLSWIPDLALEELKAPEEGWFTWRQHQGVIGRLPTGFHENSWNLFRYLQGIIIGDRLERNRMDSSVVLSDMTPGEKSFALLLEHLLNKVQSPQYRQLNVEALQVLASFFTQNQSLRINDTLALDTLIGHAVKLTYRQNHPADTTDYNEAKPQAWDEFYGSSPTQTSAALVEALRFLLTVRASDSIPPPAC